MKPKVIISRCLGFDSCRYNGDMITFDLLDIMKDKIEFITVCPELDIGLGGTKRKLKIGYKK